jgi:hypothetical protein
MLVQSGGGDIVNSSTIRSYLLKLNTNLATFENESNVANVALSTFYNQEMTSYMNNAVMISSQIMVQISKKTRDIYYSYDNYNISTISSLNGKKREYKVIQACVNDFMDVCKTELYYKLNYILYKSQYELQSKYQLTPSDSEKLFNDLEMNRVITGYDICVQEINKYMDMRTDIHYRMSTILMNSRSIFDPVIISALYMPGTYSYDEYFTCTEGTTYNLGNNRQGICRNNKIEVASACNSEEFILAENIKGICNNNKLDLKATIQPLIPFYMRRPEKIPSRRTMFPKTGFVQLEIPTCKITEFGQYNYDTNYRSSITFNITTTSTIPSEIIGKISNKVSIYLATNDVHISQVVIIDKKGRNVAFQKPSIVSMPTLSAMTFGTTTMPSLVTTTYVTNRSMTSGSIITDIGYGQRAYTPPPFSSVYKILAGSRIDIDLGEIYELTSIKIYQTQQAISTKGIRVRVSTTDSTTIEYTLPDRADIITHIDLRDMAKLTSENIANYPDNIISNQRGVCGTIARYVRILPTNTGGSSIPAGFYFHISQVAVIGNNGQNLALGKPVNTTGTTSISFTTTIRPTTTIIPSSRMTDGQYYARPERLCYTGRPSYLEIDLGSSVDVTAVHIYNKSDNPDTFQSAMSVALLTEETLYAAGPISLSTDRNKEVVDFRYTGADIICPIQLLWPSTIYGDGALICRYIRINGCNGIKRLEVVDIMGIDIGLFKNLSGDGANANTINADGNTQPYSGTWLLLDLSEKKEICVVRVDKSLSGTIYFSNVADASNNAIYSTAFYGEIDTRVDPENSSLPKVVNNKITKYGPFGIFGQIVECPGTFTIVDATGKGFGPFTGSKNMGRLYEITAINTTQGVEVKLYDCNNILTMKSYSEPNGIAPFTNPLITDAAIKALIPRTPYPVRYGYKMGTTTTALPYPDGVGVYTRYIKITPSSTSKPLKISQIVAVDASGINVAFEKEAFYMGSQSSNPQRIVDGNFQPILGIQSFISWENYIVRSDIDAYVSPQGGYVVIDLMGEYAINSILFIGTNSADQSGNIGAAVQLYDSRDNVVGINPVSELLRIYQMDLLDFRRDITQPVSDDDFSTRIEVRERIVDVGKEGCGIMGQYIRIQGSSIQLSQVILRDPFGNNIAMYKPTYSPTNQSASSKINDGYYYIRNEINGFVATDYVEINLEQEYELVSIIVAALENTPTSVKNGMLVLIYNKYRDVIAVQKELYTSIGSSFQINTNNFTILNGLLGVQNRSVLVPTKVENGLQAALASDILEKLTNVQINMNLNNRCIMINDNKPYVRDANGNIMGVRYVRVFNQLEYVKISQLMVYNDIGDNVAFHKSSKATHTLSGRYAEYATDGYGGFFHTPRLETASYISDKKRYDIFEVDLGSDNPISAVRYIPPNTTQNNLEGMRIQLLNSERRILHQYVFVSTDIGERLIDFRGVANRDVPINFLIMPKITTLF